MVYFIVYGSCHYLLSLSLTIYIFKYFHLYFQLKFLCIYSKYIIIDLLRILPWLSGRFQIFQALTRNFTFGKDENYWIFAILSLGVSLCSFLCRLLMHLDTLKGKRPQEANAILIISSLAAVSIASANNSELRLVSFLYCRHFFLQASFIGLSTQT